MAQNVKANNGLQKGQRRQKLHQNQNNVGNEQNK
ncbi:MAG: clostri-philic family protein [Clostridium perfringens]|nr:clostri-philic family protein [Clostridium perfringens]